MRDCCLICELLSGTVCVSIRVVVDELAWVAGDTEPPPAIAERRPEWGAEPWRDVGVVKVLRPVDGIIELLREVAGSGVGEGSWRPNRDPGSEVFHVGFGGGMYAAEGGLIRFLVFEEVVLDFSFGTGADGLRGSFAVAMSIGVALTLL